MNNRDEIPERARRGEPCADDGLAPLLETAARVEAAFAYNPDPARQTDALRRFNQARAELKRARAAQKPVSPRFRLPRLVWAAGLAAVALAVAGVLALRPGTVPVTYVSAETGGNLVFLLSDEENAIADFASLRLTIDRVGLLNGAGTAWIEFTPETAEIELTLLTGELSQALWQGSVPPGDYRQVYISVSAARGVLAASGASVNLGGRRLSMDKPFQVIEGGVTSFTYDVSVVAASSAGPGYALQPEPAQSGARHQYQHGEGPGPGDGQPPEQGQEREQNTETGAPAENSAGYQEQERNTNGGGQGQGEPETTTGAAGGQYDTAPPQQGSGETGGEGNAGAGQPGGADEGQNGSADGGQAGLGGEGPGETGNATPGGTSGGGSPSSPGKPTVTSPGEGTGGGSGQGK